MDAMQDAWYDQLLSGETDAQPRAELFLPPTDHRPPPPLVTTITTTTTTVVDRQQPVSSRAAVSILIHAAVSVLTGQVIARDGGQGNTDAVVVLLIVPAITLC